ncbi:Mut7-C RNAse domain-containing protein [Haloarcula marina]|uniref:Mut7-C RNAse domain-containing protein n=1 Tax=Haloarcula marina TaxID=2961574 RepID=UPI0020B7F185|nr:Mut7-C RNAse domain-containing protein [Halomicroarcula marina]
MSEPEMRDPLLLDAMLGKLATYLRMCGYDAAYALDRDAEADEDVLALVRTEGRRLVTRDERLARDAPDAVLLTEREVADQLRELAAAGFPLELSEEPRHCGTCNAPLERVDRTEPTPDYAPNPGEEPVWRCRDCGQHFWRGSHWEDVADTIADL